MAASRRNSPANSPISTPLVSAPDIVAVGGRTNRAIGDTAATFFAAEAKFRLDRITPPHAACRRTIFFETSGHRPRR